jgi:hypothetical protein
VVHTQWRTRTPPPRPSGPGLRCASLGRMSPVATRPSCTLRSRVWNLECLAYIPLALYTLHLPRPAASGELTRTQLRCSVQAPNPSPIPPVDLTSLQLTPSLTPLDAAGISRICTCTIALHRQTRRLDQSHHPLAPLPNSLQGRPPFCHYWPLPRLHRGRVGVRVRVTTLDWSHR